MEKRNPHYRLDDVKDRVARLGIGAFTRSSIDGGAEMGLSSREMIAAVLGVERGMFFKSMTTYQDHKVWQDVYHVPTTAGPAYVKFTLRTDGAVVISFKRL
jgi:motility quorum-sensing regulator / GCU-specific mRNA interferase toxin